MKRAISFSSFSLLAAVINSSASAVYSTLTIKTEAKKTATTQLLRDPRSYLRNPQNFQSHRRDHKKEDREEELSEEESFFWTRDLSSPSFSSSHTSGGKHSLSLSHDYAWEYDGAPTVSSNKNPTHIATVIEYNLTIAEKFIEITSVEGRNISRYGSLVNDQLPGPILRAKEGNHFLIYITNKQASRGAAIHWHGMKQMGTNYFDGVPGVTECNISSGSTTVYNFTAYPAGTYWYHSHEGVQYPEGQFGALIVDPVDDAELPEWEKNVEEEFIMVLSEWNVTEPETEFQNKVTEGMGARRMQMTQGMGGMEATQGMGGMGMGTMPDEADVPWPYFLMNGNASVDFNIDSSVTDKWYRFRLICATDNWNVNISLGGPHSPVLVMVDSGEYLEPSPVDTWVCPIGGRYDFLLNASLMEPGRYPIRVSDYLGVDLATPAFIVVDNGETLFDMPSNGTLTQSVFYPPPLREAFLPEPTVAEMNITIALEMPYTWKLNNISATLPSVPVYQSGGMFGMDKPISIVKVALHDVVDVLLINDNGMSHPFHLHGNTFWVLGVSTNRDGFDELNTVNPVARDTVNVPSDGMVKIRIHFDNPGPWFFHCHIDFHMLAGMAMIWYVGEPEVDWPLPDVPMRICGDTEDLAEYAKYPWSRQFIPGDYTN